MSSISISNSAFFPQADAPNAPVLGIVVAVNGTSPGPASGISYDVYVNSPNNPRTATGVKPTGPRWSDAVNTVALPVGCPVPVWYSGEYLVFQFPTELPYVETCPQ